MYLLAVTVALCVLPAPTGSSVDAFPLQPVSGVLFMGDSIAYDLAPAVETGLFVAGAGVQTFAFPGVSLTGDDWLQNGETWLADHIPVALLLSRANVVVWQLSFWDADDSPVSHDENLLAHVAFAEVALRGRTAVVFVTPPPMDPTVIDPEGGPKDWNGLVGVALEVAERYPGRVFVVDSSGAWGDSYVEFAEDGTPLRKPDGVHVCPLGATIFADFLVHWLADTFGGLEPTDTSAWPLSFWSDERYHRAPNACEDLRG